MITDESGEQHQPTLEEGWAEVVADRRATDPPVRNVFKKGAIAIRDHRVWCAPPLVKSVHVPANRIAPR